MTINDNKLCQLKLNDMDYYVNCHVRFGVSFDP